MSRWRTRLALWSAGALLWLGAGLLVAELAVRYRVRQEERRAAAYAQEVYARHDAVNARARAALDPEAPAPVDPVFDGTHFVRDLDEAARVRFARDQEAWVAIADLGGRVLHAYDGLGGASPVLRGRLPGPGGRVQDLLPVDMAADCARALNEFAAGGAHAERQYTLRAEDGAEVPVVVRMVPVREGGQTTAALVLVGPSIWREVFFRYAPNARSNAGFLFETNAQGWRGASVAVPKPPGTVRIACVGGSTTVEGVTNALTYPAFLERMLRAHFGTERIEVVNCGIEVVGSVKELALVADYLALEPDLVIHYNFINDLPYLLGRWTAPDTGGPAARLRAWLRRSELVYRRANRWLLPGDAQLVRDIEAYTLANLRALHEALDAAGCELAVCGFACPRADRLSPEDLAFFNWRINNQGWGWPKLIDIATYGHLVRLYDTLVRGWCAETGLTYIPVAEEFEGGSEVFKDICHMNADGIERKAAIIFQHIRDWTARRLAGNEPQTG